MNNKKLNILVTNDDGIHSPGLMHLWKSLEPFANMTVVAPASEQSGVSLSITLRNPLKIHQIPWPQPSAAYAVTGTPADCVKLALRVILDEKPDLVISGMNRGANSGRTLLYSGTVAGVIESVIQGIPGIAFSCMDYWKPEYAEAEEHIYSIIEHVVESPLPRGTLLNVNFPGHVEGGFKGFKMAQQGRAFWMENPSQRQHPDEHDNYYWLGMKQSDCEEHENSDVHWLRQGYITAVPIHIDQLTDHSELEKRKESFENKFLLRKNTAWV